MQSQQQIRADKLKSRVQYYEKIWNDTEGSDFDKTLAMLHAYCAYSNYGTHASAVWGKIKKYYTALGYRQTVKHQDAMAYTMEYLLFRLAEKIPFSEIKQHGTLAAIFAVIRKNTKFNPDDFDQKGELFKLYSDGQKKGGVSAVADVNTLNFFINEPSWALMLFKLKRIDIVDAWVHIVMMNTHDHQLLGKIKAFDDLGLVADEDLLALFVTEKSQNNSTFLQYLYCKKNKLPFIGIKRPKFSNSHLIYLCRLIISLCELSSEKDIDGLLLLNMITRIFRLPDIKPKCSDVNEMLLELIKRRRLIMHWYAIEDLLVSRVEKIDFTYLLVDAIRGGHLDTIKYLFNNTKINLNMNAYYRDMHVSYGEQATPLQIFLRYAGLPMKLKEWKIKTNEFYDLVNMFIKYDPDSVKTNDGRGNDIFYYLKIAEDQMLLDCSDVWKMRTVEHFFEKIEPVIHHAYVRRPFAFFSGKNCAESDISYLPPELMAILVENIMSEIKVSTKGPAFTFFGGHSDKESEVATLPKEVVSLIADYALNDIKIKKV